MFTSRPSEPRTVLLWGDRWWVAGTGAAGEFANLAQAAEILAAHFAPEPKPVRLRLVYQPDTFESVAVACPPGDRTTLAAAMGGEFPALAGPDHAWSHEPVTAQDGGHATVLHFETEPGLFALAARLAHLGLAVDSAWPFGTFLCAVLEVWGGTVVCAELDYQIVGCRQMPDGRLDIRAWHGDTAEAEATQWLEDTRTEGESRLMVWPDPAEAAHNNADEAHEQLGIHALSLAEALGSKVTLPRWHPAQLLPREPWVTARRAVIAGSLALLLAAGWSGFAYGRDWLAMRAEAGRLEARRTTLRSEVAHLRENAEEIAALRSLIEGGAAGPPCGVFLARVSATVPPEIVLGSLRIIGHEIALDGWIAPNSPAGILDDWRRRLAPADARWTLASRTDAGAAFMLTGAFRR